MERAFAELSSITEQLAAIEAQRTPLRDRAAELVVELLKADQQPSAVTAKSPFSDAHVRTLARVAGLPPARRGPRKSVR